MAERPFPSSWTVQDVSDEALAVSDANGFRLAFVYFEDHPGRRHQLARLTRDEARRIAANIAKLPELLSAKKPLEPADGRDDDE